MAGVGHRNSAVRGRRIAGVLIVAACALLPLGATAKRRPTPSASPPNAMPIPTALSRAQRLASLRAQVEALGRDATSTAGSNAVGIAIVDLQYDEHVSLHGDARFPLGNVSKLAIAFAAYRLADQNHFPLDARVAVTQRDVRSNGPIAQRYPHGGVAYPYWELVALMLVDDDETATAIVLRRIGGPAAVQGLLNRLGLRSLHIDGARAGSRLRVNDAGGTPDVVAALLAGIAENHFLLLDTSDEYVAALAHRTTIPQATIVTFPDGRRVVTVALFAPNTNEATRRTTLAGLSRAVADAFR